MDQLDMHRRAQDEFGRVLTQVSADHLLQATPCGDWNVAQLIDHVVEGNHSASTLMGRASLPDGSVSDRVERFRASSQEAIAAFAAPNALTDPVTLPFGEVPGAIYCSIRAGDVYAHAWDLATAVGVDRDLDPELGAAIHAATAPILSPELRGAGRPFADEQPCAADAPTADRFAAFLGRSV